MMSATWCQEASEETAPGRDRWNIGFGAILDNNHRVERFYLPSLRSNHNHPSLAS